MNDRIVKTMDYFNSLVADWKISHLKFIKNEDSIVVLFSFARKKTLMLIDLFLRSLDLKYEIKDNPDTPISYDGKIITISLK